MGILSALAVVFNFIAGLLFWLLMVVAFLFFSVLEFFARFFPQGNTSQETPPLQMPQGFAEQFKDLERQPVSLSPELHLILQILAGVLIAAFIIIVFALAFRRFKTLLDEDVEETHETIFSFDLLKEQLAQFFKRKSQAQGDVAPPFVIIQGDDPRAQIRRTYQALLAWAAERGVPRAPGQTPNEYLSSMARSFQLCAEPIGIITATYVQVRYSISSISEGSAQQVTRAWEQIMRTDPT